VSLIDDIFSWFYYIRIVFSLFLLGFLLGAALFIFVFNGNTYGWMFGFISVLLGLGFGIYLAESARRDMGTVNFMGANKIAKNEFIGDAFLARPNNGKYLKELGDDANGTVDKTKK
jgi:hypothetical protein